MRISTATTHIETNFQQSRLLQSLMAWYLAVWVITAINPLDRKDWVLENVLAVTLVTGLVLTYRRFPLSDTSYLLITLFLTLHAIGAHYTYSEVPLGYWLRDWGHFSRNHFDRVVHFCFGLLMASRSARCS